jgi:hypothetical protein
MMLFYEKKKSSLDNLLHVKLLVAIVVEYLRENYINRLDIISTEKVVELRR